MDTPKILLQLDVSRVCGREILQGICKYANSFTNWNLIMTQPSYLVSIEDGDISANRSLKKIDAIITDRLISPKVYNFLKIPIIQLNLLDTPDNDHPGIMANEKEIAKIAFDYFTSLGFENFAYCGFVGIKWSSKRGVYFKKLIKKTNYKANSLLIPHHDGRFVSDDTIQEIADWLKKQKYPIALFACNDDCAKLVAKACKLGEIQSPQEVSILGVDNDEVICLTSSPELSSISLDFEKAGFDAAIELKKIITNNNKVKTPIIINPIGTISRKSTDSSAVKDPVLRKCLQFISQNVNKNIGVPEVVEVSCISRRSLEYKFKKNFGISIYKQIRKTRVRHISSLLIKTKLTIAQISHNLGFCEPEHFSRYFKIETGISPNHFRKRYK